MVADMADYLRAEEIREVPLFAWYKSK
jgi:hypothetical protein